MAWHSTWPVGSVSVKANRITGQENTTYTENTMGNDPVGTYTSATRDHFWNVGSDEDGRHRFMQSPGFTIGGIAADPLIAAGMDGVRYLRSDGLSPARVVGFYRNAQTIYQYIPAYRTGTINIPSSSSYVAMVTVPDNSYGEIFMYNTDADTGKYSAQVGFFKAKGGVVESFSLNYQVDGSGSADNALKFGNGSNANLLNIMVRRESASSSQQNWIYKVMYRAL